MSRFKFQEAAHNWLKQGKVISDIASSQIVYYKIVDGYLQVYGREHKWMRCKCRLEYWFIPENHPFMSKSRLKDIPNYTGEVDKYTPSSLINACKVSLKR